MDVEYIRLMRAKVEDTARRMLDDKCSYIEGCRLINSMLKPVRLKRLEEPFVAFVAIDSETDAVPIGEVRDRWHPEAKVKFAQEWA